MLFRNNNNIYKVKACFIKKNPKNSDFISLNLIIALNKKNNISNYFASLQIKYLNTSKKIIKSLLLN